MASIFPKLALALCLTLTTHLTPALAQLTDAATLSASMRSQAAYSLLPACINQCIWDIGGGDTNKIGGDLAEHLSCGSPWINGCYCRQNSATYAHSFISGCATYLCSTPKEQDIASGTSVYASYCSAALGDAYRPEGVEQQMGPTEALFTATSAAGTGTRGAATSRPTTGQPKETGTGGSPSNPSSSSEAEKKTGNSSNSNNSSDQRIWGLSKGAFIGVVVSASCSILGLIFGVVFKIYKHRKDQRRQGKLHSGPNGYYVTTK